MRKIIALIIFAATVLSLLAISVSAYTPMTVEEMNDALTEGKAEGELGGMAVAWDFDDLKTVTKEYALDAYTEAETLAARGKYTVTDETEDELLARDTEGLVGVRTITSKDGSAAVTIYKFESIAAATEYALLLEAKYAPPVEDEEVGEEDVAPVSDPDAVDTPYVRHGGYLVLEGDRDLVYRIGVEVVENVVPVNNPPKDIYSYYSSVGSAIFDGEYTSIKDNYYGTAAFKTPDAGMRVVDGALLVTEKHKDYHVTPSDLPSGMASYEGYMSADAYIDVYPNSATYQDLHAAYGGDSFVFTARMKAPYMYTANDPSGMMTIFSPRSNFTVKIDGENKKITFDQALIRYDLKTREIVIYSDGKAVNTGIYLTDYDYTTIAVHVEPSKNTFDFYVDGVLVADDSTFLSAANIAQIHADPYADPTGETSDYTLTRARLFYASRAQLVEELLLIDEFAIYYSDEYLERTERDVTVSGVSFDAGDKLRLNFLLNLPTATRYDYFANVEMTASEHTEKNIAMMGEKVTCGEYAGCYKYSIELSPLELVSGVELSITSHDGRAFYLYGSERAENGFMGVRSYEFLPKDYFAYVLNEENGFDAKTRSLARAVLNYYTSMAVYYDSLENYGTSTLRDLPNRGFEYTGEELGAVSSDTVKSSMKSELYKTYATFGSVRGLRLTRLNMSFDDGVYIDLEIGYTGSGAIYVNGERTEDKEFRLYVSADGASRGALGITFADVEGEYIVVVPPYALLADAVESTALGHYAVDMAKAFYLYSEAIEAYRAADQMSV